LIHVTTPAVWHTIQFQSFCFEFSRVGIVPQTTFTAHTQHPERYNTRREKGLEKLRLISKKMKTTKTKENVPGCFGSTQTSHGANDLTIVLAKCFAFKIVVKHQCCHFLFLRARTDTFMDKTPSRPNVFVRVPRKKKKDKPKKEPQKKNPQVEPTSTPTRIPPPMARNGTQRHQKLRVQLTRVGRRVPPI
jgi:hypothetical protein